MNASAIDLTSLLKAIALLQLGVALLNLFLVRLFNWRADLLRAPLLLREVFQVHAWFISITLTVFATMTWRFAKEFAGRTDPMCQWLAAGIGIFWAIRTVLQGAYYSSSHWRGQTCCCCMEGAPAFISGWHSAI